MAPRSPWETARDSSTLIQRSVNSGPQEPELATSYSRFSITGDEKASVAVFEVGEWQMR